MKEKRKNKLAMKCRERRQNWMHDTAKKDTFKQVYIEGAVPINNPAHYEFREFHPESLREIENPFMLTFSMTNKSNMNKTTDCFQKEGSIDQGKFNESCPNKFNYLRKRNTAQEVQYKR